MIAPSPLQLFKAPIAKIAISAIGAAGAAIRIIRGDPLADALGETLGDMALRPATGRLKSGMYKSLMMAQIKGDRTLLDPAIAASERDVDGRVVRRMRIMFHDANRAGKHLDVHIGRTSLIYRITGKPVESKIKFNNKGELTQESKEALLEHLRKEIANNSRVAQNLDHTITNAKCSWMMGDLGLEGYGSGATRQMVAEDDVEFYHHRVRSSEHVYAPLLFGNQGTYLYQIYPGKDTGTPILIWGKLIPRDIKFQDRLHLTLIQPEELDKFVSKIDPWTNTRKYDGASCHFHSDTGQGFKFFSPRFSKETGHRIEYTYKLPEMAEVGHPAKPVGMGELLFWKRTPAGILLREFSDWRGPEGICWNYLKASEIGGVLNSHHVRPRDIWPEVRVYRIDRWNGVDTYNLPFWENRNLQILMTSCLNSDYWRVVSLAAPRVNCPESWEGYVAVPEGESINNGYKLKFLADAEDWKCVGSELYLSDKGNIAGMINFINPAGKPMNLGPGQIGSFDSCMEIMDNPERFIGSYAKVVSRLGHSGRAAKLQMWHMDK